MGVLIRTASLIFPSSCNYAQFIFHILDKNIQCSPKREGKLVLLVTLDKRLLGTYQHGGGGEYHLIF